MKESIYEAVKGYMHQAHKMLDILYGGTPDQRITTEVAKMLQAETLGREMADLSRAHLENSATARESAVAINAKTSEFMDLQMSMFRQQHGRTDDEPVKNVNYGGLEIVVPEWVNWIATDKDGTVCGYEFKSTPGGAKWIGNGKTCAIDIGEHATESCDAWRHTLRSV